MSSLSLKSKPSPEATDARQADQYAARRFLWRESRLNRLRHCGSSLSKHAECKQQDGTKKRTNPLGNKVQVKYSNGIAGYSGLQTCGSVWACPPCAQKIMAHRAGEVQKAVDGWHDTNRHGPGHAFGRVIFLTLTMRHNRRQSLEQLLEAGSYGWSKVTSGRGWEDDSALYGTYLPRTVKSGEFKGETRFGHKIHYIRALEVTRTAKNGWHVHFHTLLFVKDDTTDADVRNLTRSVFGRWSSALRASGLGTPTLKNGIDVKLVRRNSTASALGDYFTKSSYVGRIKENKTGLEVAYGMGKGGAFTDQYTGRVVEKGRTPFGILADALALGDADDLELWNQWELASKGRRQLTWSLGLRDHLSIADEETDETVAAMDFDGAVVMTFDRDEWRWLRWSSDFILKLVRDGVRDKPLLLSMIRSRQQTQTDVQLAA